MARRDNINKLLVNYNRRLQALQERKALYGLDTPIAILTEIEDIESQIEALQAELQTLERPGSAPAPQSLTAARIAEAAGAKRRPPLLLWLGAGLLLIVVGAGLFAFWAGGANNRGDAVPAPTANVVATGQAGPPAPAAILTVDELENRLQAANIVFSTGTAEDRARVRSYVTGPTSAYYLLAVNSLELIGPQRFKQTEHLDMIDKWYTLRVGEDNYVAKGNQLHREELKAAIVQAHNEYYSDTATAFEQLIEP